MSKRYAAIRSVAIEIDIDGIVVHPEKFHTIIKRQQVYITGDTIYLRHYQGQINSKYVELLCLLLTHPNVQDCNLKALKFTTDTTNNIDNLSFDTHITLQAMKMLCELFICPQCPVPVQSVGFTASLSEKDSPNLCVLLYALSMSGCRVRDLIIHDMVHQEYLYIHHQNQNQHDINIMDEEDQQEEEEEEEETIHYGAMDHPYNPIPPPQQNPINEYILYDIENETDDDMEFFQDQVFHNDDENPDNVNDLNPSMHNVAKSVRKQNAYLYCLFQHNSLLQSHPNNDVILNIHADNSLNSGVHMFWKKNNTTHSMYPIIPLTSWNTLAKYLLCSVFANKHCALRTVSMSGFTHGSIFKRVGMGIRHNTSLKRLTYYHFNKSINNLVALADMLTWNQSIQTLELRYLMQSIVPDAWHSFLTRLFCKMDDGEYRTQIQQLLLENITIYHADKFIQILCYCLSQHTQSSILSMGPSLSDTLSGPFTTLYPHLTHLALRRCKLTDDTFVTVCDTLLLPQYEQSKIYYLDLSYNSITPQGMQYFRNRVSLWAHHCNLISLNLPYNFIRYTGLVYLLEALDILTHCGGAGGDSTHIHYSIPPMHVNIIGNYLYVTEQDKRNTRYDTDITIVDVEEQIHIESNDKNGVENNNNTGINSDRLNLRVHRPFLEMYSPSTRYAYSNRDFLNKKYGVDCVGLSAIRNFLSKNYFMREFYYKYQHTRISIVFSEMVDVDTTHYYRYRHPSTDDTTKHNSTSLPSMQSKHQLKVQINQLLRRNLFLPYRNAQRMEYLRHKDSTSLLYHLPLNIMHEILEYMSDVDHFERDFEQSR